MVIEFRAVIGRDGFQSPSLHERKNHLYYGLFDSGMMLRFKSLDKHIWLWALHQCHQTALLFGSDNQINFPVSETAPIGLRRSFMYGHMLRDAAGYIGIDCFEGYFFSLGFKMYLNLLGWPLPALQQVNGFLHHRLWNHTVPAYAFTPLHGHFMSLSPAVMPPIAATVALKLAW